MKISSPQKNRLQLFAVIAGLMFISATGAQAQCHEFACPEDVTLYVPDGSCEVPYFYTNPQVINSCEASNSFHFSGESQFWVVPDGIYTIRLSAYGASGGHGSGPEYVINMGGKGGFATGKIAVNPGDTVYIFIGDRGANAKLASSAAGGWNGGGDGGFDATYVENSAGGGGGATDFRIGGMALENRVLVAAGGGGAGKNVPGGDGGAEVGMDGQAYGVGAPGLGGTIYAGGAVATTERGATAGEFGIGGNGSTNSDSHGGGGGGAGYYGGSGGTATTDHLAGHSGSGGGGSSYVGGVTEGVTIPSQRIGTGLAVIFYPNVAMEESYLVQGPENGSSLPVGTTDFTFAYQAFFDTLECSYSVTVLDTISPVARAKDITLTLDVNNEATLNPAAIDDGSTDNCSIASLIASQTDFDLNDMGSNTITLTVIDGSGNSNSTTCNVEVIRGIQEMVEQRTPDYRGAPNPSASKRSASAGYVEALSPEPTMQIYPNPSSENLIELKVSLPESWERAYLEVYNSSGQQVIKQFVPLIMPTDRMRLPVGHLGAGIYLVQLSTDNKSVTQRLVIQ